MGLVIGVQKQVTRGRRASLGLALAPSARIAVHGNRRQSALPGIVDHDVLMFGATLGCLGTSSALVNARVIVSVKRPRDQPKSSTSSSHTFTEACAVNQSPAVLGVQDGANRPQVASRVATR